MWIDSQSHLYDLTEQELTETLERARPAHVHRVVNSATTLDTSRTVLDQCANHSSLVPTVGISPFDVPNLPSDWQERMESFATEPGVAAIGEIGLDDSNPAYPSLASQVPVFEKLLEIARTRDLPAIMHSRGAERTVLDTCLRMGITRGVFHCYTGSLDILRDILDHGYVVSFSGIVTFKRNNLADLVEFAPPDRILIETDSPYLAPIPFRGKVNEPAHVALIGAKIAEIKGMKPDALADTIRQTFGEIFGQPFA